MIRLEKMCIQIFIRENLWKGGRFLDIFLIWFYGEEKLKEFLKQVNDYYRTIKYTRGWSVTNISYLDVMVDVHNKRITTDVYGKPTDTYQYLDKGSCHPRRVKRGIPYGQALANL